MWLAATRTVEEMQGKVVEEKRELEKGRKEEGKTDRETDRETDQNVQ